MSEQEKFHRAKQRVESLRAFYTHLIIYVIVNIGLVVVNLLTSPEKLWFYWVTIFWGVGLLIHAFTTFGGKVFLGREWEEQKIKDYMEKDEE